MDWEKFDKDTIKAVHGDMYKYRDLYRGRHAQLFTRAKELIDKGEVIDYLEHGKEEFGKVRTPYLIYNVSKIICDIPALLVSRSIGNVFTDFKKEESTGDFATPEEAEMIETTEDDSFNSEIIDLQQQVINSIVDNSKLQRKHKSNIVQHQVDGGIVGVPVIKNGRVSIQFKERNVYYPHDDGLGADLVYELDKKSDNDEDYVHVYTEREEEKHLDTTNRLYKRNRVGKMTEVTDLSEIEEVTGIKPKDLSKRFVGRKRMFIDYWGNETSFMNPLGVSTLEGQEGKQEEVNWTITRTSQTFERNGKPRISITEGLFTRLMELAQERGENKIDHRDLEVMEMDSEGRSIQVHQIDIDKIGNMDYVKDIIRAMLAETQTSESATELLNGKTQTASAQSGIAKFYELFTSFIKAESIRKEYIEFLENLFESALWLANKQTPNIIIEKPYIETNEVIPSPKEEKDLITIQKYNAKVISLETAIKELNPDRTDEWVYREVDRLLTEQSSDDTFSLNNGRQTLQNILGNRNPLGEPLNADGTTRTTEDSETETDGSE